MISLIVMIIAFVNLYFVLKRKWYAKDPYIGLIVSVVITLIAVLNLIRLVVT